jgi:predicted hotdog family 3-hydroxylacyl-ACP dehydratase
MNLPHQEPIRFVKELLQIDDEYAFVSCSFPTTPTLAMVCEAAAQSSAAFAQDNKSIPMGFLVSLKNIELLNELIHNNYIIKIKRETIFGSMSEFKFELTKDSIVYVTGYLVIALPDETSK